MDVSISKRPAGATAGLKPLLLTSSAIATLLFLLSLPRGPNCPRFSIVIDAGSSGIRLHVFPYTVVADRGPLPVIDFGSAAVLKSSPGISAYEHEPDRAGEALAELLGLAGERVPRERWGETEIRLMATAGMRLLDAPAQERILEACRRVLRSSGFKFRDEWATVISGSDEGIYAWVTANFALGTLGDDPEKTTGIIELGGASAQVTFVPSEPFPAEFSHILKFGRHTYNLYTHSFLHLGQIRSREKENDLEKDSESSFPNLSFLVLTYHDGDTKP